jgi:hypothetical protein
LRNGFGVEINRGGELVGMAAGLKVGGAIGSDDLGGLLEAKGGGLGADLILGGGEDGLGASAGDFDGVGERAFGGAGFDRESSSL